MTKTIAKISIAFLTLTIALLFSGCVIPVIEDMAVDISEGSAAQEPGPEWVVFDTKNSELPMGTVFDLAVDDDNSLWIGTRSGLANYGVEGWIVYTTDNSGLPANKTTALALDESGALWVGTAHGLARFDSKNWEVYTSENSDLPYDAHPRTYLR